VRQHVLVDHRLTFFRYSRHWEAIYGRAFCKAMAVWCTVAARSIKNAVNESAALKLRARI
jgi:hypothetical protein